MTGSLVQWLRDQLGIITTAPEIETLADSVVITAASTSSQRSRPVRPVLEG